MEGSSSTLDYWGAEVFGLSSHLAELMKFVHCFIGQL